MAEKPKKVRPKTKKKLGDQKQQSKRFIEAARKVGADENSNNFEDAFKKIMKAK